ncbi:hypothetical protein SAMN05444000_10356 [Shimia gijangensis]|uniref:Phytase-like domain-containing protein n=1 Tax=Shimia gijangensis TaxID=1470563 RepID=A0A1M6DZG5_9RHOB|nr:hypothetical protein [Shimia gijangensis]SHI78539.1 hypothetical protein SAMN05444000_10356 [Shimia gijangensis]
MRSLFAFCLTVSTALPVWACERPVCLVEADSLHLARHVTFDDLPSGFGVGRQIEGILDQNGVRFGERFSGQSLTVQGDFDGVEGTASAPLTLLPGAPGETLGILRLMRTSVLQGHGPRGFPRAEAVGEGAIAAIFDYDQSAISLDIRGGELGEATVTFLSRDGQKIDTHTLGPLSETSHGFLRQHRKSDIAGILITNTDPEGIALDNLRFDQSAILGWLR